MSSTLADTLAGYGLIVASIVADGEIHRCGTLKKPKGKNGWYIAFPDSEAAIFGNWESGDGYEYWRRDGAKEFRPADLKRIEKIKAQQEQDKLLSADDAIDYIESCSKDGFSDYLKRKQIFPHGVRFDTGCIVIPLQDASGKIWSYQKIYGNGDKYFMPGGRVKGCYYPLFNRNVAKDELVIVCEGFATGAAIAQETKLPVIVAFNAGNLKAVCDSIPFRNIMIAADHDESGVGEKYAKESGYKYVMPKKAGWDYSDVFLNKQSFKDDFLTEEKKAEQIIHVESMVSEIADWITSTAIRPQPALSLSAAISLMGMIKSQRVKTKIDLRTNVYCLSLAPTAAGKEYPQKAIRRIISCCGLDKHAMAEPTSGAGLLTGLIKANKISLLTIDELGHYVSNITSQNSGSYQKEIASYIIKLFSKASGIFEGKQYANEKLNPTYILEQPHLSCYGSSVEERMQEACGSAFVIDGFLNRWLIFSTQERPKKNRDVNDYTPPEDLINKIKLWQENYPLELDKYGNPSPKEISFTPEAYDMFIKYDEDMEAKTATAPYPMDKLYARSAEHVEKLALILTDGDFIGVPEIQKAISIVEESNKHIIRFASMIADNETEADYIRVRELTRKEKTISKNDLTRRTQRINGGDRRRNEIIQSLIDSNLIVEIKEPNNKKIVYKWIGN